jgi:hypothetical protein
MDVAQTGARPLRTIVILGGLVALLVVTAVVVSLVLAPGEPASYPADSPEYAFQRYYQALQDGDTRAAYSLFSARVQRQLSYDQFAAYAGRQPQTSEQSPIVRIDRVTRGDEGATLSLSLEQRFGSGFGQSSDVQQRSVRLVQENGAWKIDDAIVGVDLILLAPPP